MKKEKFELMDHVSDIKFKIYGSTLNEVFENAVLAFASYVGSGEKINSKKGRVIEVRGNDNESLLYNFFDELIYLLEAENFLAAKASVLLRGNNLKAELFGDEASNYRLNLVKAATYSEMKIEKKEDGWEAQIVLDV
jgi:SHS2 domain-containing protein